MSLLKINKPSVLAGLVKSDITIDIYAPIVITTLVQHFINQTDDVIEAIYRFPSPKAGCVSKVAVTINGECYQGQVTNKAQGQQDYEQGIEEGVRAVLVHQLDDGIFEVVAGNMAPKDNIDISVTISQLMQSIPDGFRYMMPTVITPKYGDEHRDFVVERSIFAQYPFTATLNNHRGTIRCISHAVNFNAEHTPILHGFLDQDIVLNVELPDAVAYSLTAFDAPYPCELAVIPTSPQQMSHDHVQSVVLLVDCSGSMAGQSIMQVKKGLTALLGSLDGRAEISIMCFGSHIHLLTPEPVILDSWSGNRLTWLIQAIEADMGGTEMYEAIVQAQKHAIRHQKNAHIVLLTDGQVHGYAHKIKIATRELSHAVPLHCIGIGSAVSDDFVLSVAQRFHGQACFLHPHEPMDSAIAHFLMSVLAEQQDIDWNVGPHDYVYLPRHISKVYGACGMIAYGDNPPSVLVLNNNPVPSSDIPAPFDKALQAIIGQQYLRADNNISVDTGAALSIELGLINASTAFVMVSDEHVIGATGIPTVIHSPQMLSSDTLVASHGASETYYLDVPAFLQQPQDGKPSVHVVAQTDVIDMLEKVNTKLNRPFNRSAPSVELLKQWGLSEKLVTLLLEQKQLDNKAYSNSCIAYVLLQLNERFNGLNQKSIQKLEHWSMLHFASEKANTTFIDTLSSIINEMR